MTSSSFPTSTRDPALSSSFSDEMHVRQSLKDASTAFLFRQLNVDDVAAHAVADAAVSLDKPSLDQVQSPQQKVPRSESSVIRSVVHVIDDIEDRQRDKGFRESKFTFGVLNCLLVAYAFGAFPQHFWIIYLVECLYFLPHKFVNMLQAKPLCGAFYFMDFCWIMNFLGLLVVCFLLLDSQYDIPWLSHPDVRKNLYMSTFGIACGPLTGATGALPFVAFLFHDLNTMTNLIIHLMPPMLMYTLRWHADDIRSAYGTTFHLSYLEEVNFFPVDKSWVWYLWPPTGRGSIAGNAVIVYIFWFVPYVIWMAWIGMDLPRQTKGKTPKYDTVFHSNWRTGACEVFGTLVWGRSRELSKQQMKTDDYEFRDFALYMAIHAFLILISIPTLGLLSNMSPQAHGFLLLMLLVICVHRGSERYTYYVTEMYGDRVRKQFLKLSTVKED